MTTTTGERAASTPFANPTATICMDATGVLSAPVRIDNQNLHSVFAHDLAVSTNGMAVAVWYYGAEFDIWANVFR